MSWSWYNSNTSSRAQTNREPEIEYLSSQATTYCKYMVDDDLVAKTISYKQVWFGDFKKVLCMMSPIRVQMMCFRKELGW
jgi:hypothetical protein